MATLDELLVSLGFEYDPSELEEFQSDLNDTISIAKKFAAAFAAGASALIGFTIASTRASDEQGKLADEIGIAVNKLDALQFANRRAGGSSDGLASSLQQLSIRIGETARGVGSGLEAFGLLGISVNNANGSLKTTDQVLLEVAGRFNTFSKSQQIELADKLGLRDSVRLLQQGSAGIKDLVREAELLGVTTEKDAAVSADFQDSLTDVWQIVKQLSRTITQSLAPVMEDMVTSFTEWWKTNRKLIEQNVPKFIAQAAMAIKLLTIAATAFIAVRLLGTLASLITLMKGLTVSTLLANAAVLLLPTLIAAGIAAVALLAEDAKVFFEGGESFIGDMIKKFPEWGDAIRVVAAIFATLAEMTTMIFDGWKEIFSFFTSGTVGEDLLLVFRTLQEGFGGFVDGIISSMDNAVTGILDNILGVFSGLKDKIADAFSLGNIKDKIGDALDISSLKDSVFGLFSSEPAEVPDTPSADTPTVRPRVPSAQHDQQSRRQRQQRPSADEQGRPGSALMAGDVMSDQPQPVLMAGDVTVDQPQPVLMAGDITVEQQAPALMAGDAMGTETKVQPEARIGTDTTDGAEQPLVNSSFSQSDITNNSSSNSNTNINGGITITVSGNDSPADTASAIRAELANLAEQTSIDMNSAVRI